MKIGSYQLPGTVIAAPMAGVTDLPYRRLCRRFGAALTVSEMVHADPALRHGSKSQWRTNHTDEPAPVVAQLLGTEPGMLAEAARRNGVRVARLAEQAGIQAIAVHGRTRACKYQGEAEYDTIRRIKRSVRIPVIANGDITSPDRAGMVLDYTGADAVMIGRAGQGRPWLYGQIQDHIAGRAPREPGFDAQAEAMLEHVEALYEFYGEHTGVRIARKHICWYTRTLKNGETFWKSINRLETAKAQKQTLKSFLQQQSQIPQAA